MASMCVEAELTRGTHSRVNGGTVKIGIADEGKQLCMKVETTVKGSIQEDTKGYSMPTNKCYEGPASVVWPLVRRYERGIPASVVRFATRAAEALGKPLPEVDVRKRKASGGAKKKAGGGVSTPSKKKGMSKAALKKMIEAAAKGGDELHGSLTSSLDV